VIRISVWPGDLSDLYLRHVTQLGVDCIDFGAAETFPGVVERGFPDLEGPGVVERGFPDLEGVLAIKKKLSSWGLAINRVTLPNISEAFMKGEPGLDHELAAACAALRVFGEAGVPIARQRFGGDAMPHTGRSRTNRFIVGAIFRAASMRTVRSLSRAPQTPWTPGGTGFALSMDDWCLSPRRWV